MLHDIRLQKFRSYQDSSFEFSPGVNIIVGPNASGKTNLLEGIMVIAGGKSYRAKDHELIKFSKPWARLDADTPSGHRTVKLVKRDEHATEKIIFINNQPVKRLTITKKIPLVLFEPTHLQLLHEGPEHRRDYLDTLLEQLKPEFSQLRGQYRRTLNQRNHLLKLRPNKLHQQLFVWNVRLSELGGQIARYRHELIEQINKQLPKLYQAISKDKTKASAQYHSSIAIGQYSSSLLHKLEASTEQDLQSGFTNYGPHRDDLRILLHGHNAQQSASRGEVRTLLLALKIIELGMVEEVFNTKPLLLLDDVFSELDGARRQALTKTITGYQTFITTTDADIVVQHFLEKCNIIPIDKISRSYK